MKKIIVLLITLSMFYFCKENNNKNNSNVEVKKKVETNLLGKRIFKTTCASCHGQAGLGDGLAGATLKVKPRSFVNDKFKYGESIAQIVQTLKSNKLGPSMPAFPNLSDEQLKAVAKYVLNLKNNK